jgi:hypothetical protein
LYFHWLVLVSESPPERLVLESPALLVQVPELVLAPGWWSVWALPVWVLLAPGWWSVWALPVWVLLAPVLVSVPQEQELVSEQLVLEWLAPVWVLEQLVLEPQEQELVSEPQEQAPVLASVQLVSEPQERELALVLGSLALVQMVPVYLHLLGN